MKSVLAAVAALGLALLPQPAAAEQKIEPDKPGIWGFAYGEVEPGITPHDLAERDGISCLAEPVLIEPRQGGGYTITAFTIDPDALARNQVRYYLRNRSACSYDPKSGLEECRGEVGDPSPYWSYYEPLDPARGIYRSHALGDEAMLEEFQATGKLPDDTWPFVAFYCPRGLRPRFEALAGAVADSAAHDAAYERLTANIGACGLPLCGEDAERLRKLTGR